MISNQILQNTIDGLKGITRTDLCVIDVEGKILAATFPNAEAFIEPAQAFVASPADSQVINGCQFFKVFDDHQLEYVLLAYGDSEDVLLETLSIIAYKQPVTKAEIEKIRGVSSEHAVSKLVEYNLVQELGRLDAPGRPLLFGTTEEFLRSFGVSSIDELPVLSPVQVEEFKQEAEEEMHVKLDV